MTILTDLDLYNDRLEAVARRMAATVEGLIGPQPDDECRAAPETSHVAGQMRRLDQVVMALEGLSITIDREVCAPPEEPMKQARGGLIDGGSLATLAQAYDSRYAAGPTGGMTMPETPTFDTLSAGRRPIRDSPQA